MTDELQDYRLLNVPGYMEWSKRKLAEGESEALIAHLDAMGMLLRPSEMRSFSEAEFEDILEGLRIQLRGSDDD